MSQAFVREGDDQSLEDVGPSLNALTAYLSRQNNGMRIYEKKNFIDKDGREIHEMSDGLSYSKDSDGKWKVVYLK